MDDMNMRANASRNFPGRTYRFYTGNPIYEFGHGLSYTKYTKFIISAPSTITIVPKTAYEPFNVLNQSFAPKSNACIDISQVNCQNLKFELVVGVQNQGKMDGSHVVLVFWKPAAQGPPGMPNIQLVGFEKVEVKHGKTVSVTVKLDVCKDLSIVDTQGKRKLVFGHHTIVIGSPSEQRQEHHFDIKLGKWGG